MDPVEHAQSRHHAIRVLLDHSQLSLHALAHNQPPAVIRRRLLEHLAGASTTTQRSSSHPPIAPPSPLSLSAPPPRVLPPLSEAPIIVQVPRASRQ